MRRRPVTRPKSRPVLTHAITLQSGEVLIDVANECGVAGHQCVPGYARMAFVAQQQIVAIPRSRDDPELRWVYDTEVVGDLIAVSAPVPGHVVAQEVQHCAAEVREGAVALVVGGMSVHQPP